MIASLVECWGITSYTTPPHHMQVCVSILINILMARFLMRLGWNAGWIATGGFFGDKGPFYDEEEVGVRATGCCEQHACMLLPLSHTCFLLPCRKRRIKRWQYFWTFPFPTGCPSGGCPLTMCGSGGLARLPPSHALLAAQCALGLRG